MVPKVLIKKIREELGNYKEVNVVLDWLGSCFNKPEKFVKFDKAHYGALVKSPYFNEIRQAILHVCRPEDQQKLATLLQKLFIANQLAYRFSLGGVVNIDGAEIQLEGGLIQVVLDELKYSHTVFRQTENYQKVLQQIQEKTGHRLSQEYFDKIEEDIQRTVVFDRDLTAGDFSENRVLNIPIRLKTTSATGLNIQDQHYINLAVAGDFIFIGNNGGGNIGDYSGILVFKILDKESTIREINNLKNSVTEDYCLENCYTNIFNSPSIQFNGLFELKPQKTSNCSWSSCAKMIVRCTAFAHFYRLYAEKADSNLMALVQAQIIMSLYSKMFAQDDRERALHQALIELQSLGPIDQDMAVLIAEIYLKCENRGHRKKLIDLIEQSGVIISDEVRLIAENRLHHMLVEEKAQRWRSQIAADKKTLSKSQFKEYKEYAETRLLDFEKNYQTLYLQNGPYWDYEKQMNKDISGKYLSFQQEVTAEKREKKERTKIKNKLC